MLMTNSWNLVLALCSLWLVGGLLFAILFGRAMKLNGPEAPEDTALGGDVGGTVALFGQSEAPTASNMPAQKA